MDDDGRTICADQWLDSRPVVVRLTLLVLALSGCALATGQRGPMTCLYSDTIALVVNGAPRGDFYLRQEFTGAACDTLMARYPNNTSWLY
jgi:hypothetical protein